MNMMKKLQKTGLVVLLGLCLAAGCGQTDGKQESMEENNVQSEQNQENAGAITPTKEPVPTAEPTATPVPLTEEEQIHLDMLERSVISTGNNERMKKSYRKSQKWRGCDPCLHWWFHHPGLQCRNHRDFCQAFQRLFPRNLRHHGQGQLCECGT